MIHESEFRPVSSRARSRARTASQLHRFKLLLLKRGWVLLLGLALGLTVAWAILRLGPQEFLSVGRMIVNVKLSLPEGAVFSEEMSSFLGTQSALMQSGVVLNRAQVRVGTKDPDLAARNADWEKTPVSVRVSVVPKTTIFVLQAVARDPEYARAFLRACMEEYIQVKREMRVQTSDTTLAGLTEEILRLEKEVRRSNQEVAAFQNTNSAMVLQDQANNSGNYLGLLNQRLAVLRSELALLQALTPDQNAERLPLMPELVGMSTAQPSEAQSEHFKARQQILLLKAEQADLGQYLRPRHPKMMALGDEVSRRERLLKIFRQQNAEQLESRKNSLAVQIAHLEKDGAAWEARLLEASRKSAEFAHLKANAARIQSVHDRLLATMETLDVNKEISPESVTIMEHASPGFAAQPRLGKQLVKGGLLGLALAAGLLLLLDRMDDRLTGITELKDAFNEEVLSQIPLESQEKGAPSLIQTDDRRHGFCESYRNLRSSLVFMGEAASRPRLLLVTSSVPGEGKSLTAANLAITLAQAGSRVLLVDADLRKGALHERLGVAVGPGVAEVLAGRADWREAVQSKGNANLFFLPRGAATLKSGEYFLGKKAATLLKEAAAAYDYVLLDTAPVMAADDVTSLAPQVEGVIFVVRAEHTSTRVARAAMDLLYQRQAKLLGLVFNGVRPNSAEYHCYRYSDYYRPYPEAQKA